MRTQRSRSPKSRVSSQCRTMGRVAAFRSGVTASSRSRMRPSAGSVSALASIRSLPPGTKCSERRMVGGLGVPPPHHGRAAAAHDEVAVLVPGPVLEDHDAPRRARLRLALLHHLGLRVDGVAVEHRLGKLYLLEAEIAHRGAQRGVAYAQSPRDAESEEAVDQRPAELRLLRGVEVDM